VDATPTGAGPDARRHRDPGNRPRRWLRVAAVAVAAASLSLAACGNDDGPPEGTTTYDVDGVEVNAIARSPERADGPILTVLFLHGQAYDSDIWDELGVLDDVVEAGHRAVAVDLPGHGGTAERPTEGTEPLSDGAWLQQLVDEVGKPELTVIVSPSMSGRYSLAMLEEFPEQELAGFVPVAPVGVEELDRPDDAVDIANMVTYGADDPAYAQLLAEQLVAQLHGQPSTIAVIPDAGHAAYEDETDQFTDLLLGFLAQLEP
jgi:abhydrolase domain-containing protein 14